MDNLRKFFSLDNVVFTLIIIVILVVYIPFIFSGGVIYDDWSVLSLGVHSPGIFSSYQAYFPSFSNRPLAPLLLGAASNLFGQNVAAYIILTLVFWISSILAVAVVVKRYFNRAFLAIFAAVAVFPVFSSVVIFSPAMLLIGSGSVFLWAISFIFLDSAIDRSKLKTVFYAVSYFLTICSVLLYEVVFPLFIISALWSLVRLEKNYFPLTKDDISKYLSKFVLPFVLITALIFIYQKVIVTLFANDISRLRFRGLIIIPAVLAKFLTVITVDIPHLLLSSLFFIGSQISFLDLMTIILIPGLLLALFLGNREPAVVISRQQKIFIVSVITTLVSFLFFYMLAATVPTINGYYNRGLISFSLATALAIAFFGYYAYVKKSKWFFVVLIFLFLYLTSFVVQRNNYIDSWRLQNTIINDVLQKADEHNLSKEAVILGNVPEYLESNFNNETVFSDEVGDFGIAIWLRSGGQLGTGNTLTKIKIDNNRVKFSDNEILIDKFRADVKNIWFYQYNLGTKESVLFKVNDINQLKGIMKNISGEDINKTRMPLEVWRQIIVAFKSKINNK